MISFESFKKNIKRITYDDRILKGYIVETEKGSIGFYLAGDNGGDLKDYIRIHVFSGYIVEFSRILGNESQWHYAGEENIKKFMEFLKNHEKNYGEVLTLEN